MRTLLIVDDEPRQVRALSAIIGKKWPHYRIVEAMDAETAWEHLQRETVDAMLTDIRMPGMDGLSLAELVAKEKPHIRTVLISGYGQFEYAKKAIELRVVEYLVKPIGLPDIERVVDKLQVLFDREAIIRQSESVYREHLWNGWLNGDLSDRQRSELFLSLPQDGSGVAIVLEKTGRSGEPDDAEPMADEDAVMSIWAESLSKLGWQTCFADASKKRIFSLVRLAGDIAAAKPAEAARAVGRLLERTLDRMAASVRVGVSSVQPALFASAAEACEEASLALRHRFYADERRILWRSDVRPFEGKAAFGSKELAASLAAAVLSGERGRATERLNSLFSFREPPFPDPSALKAEAHLLFRNVLDSVHGGSLASCEQLSYARMKRQFESCESCGELRLRFKDGLDTMAELASRKSRQDKNAQLILNCQGYLQERYMEDLSLESVAQLYHFNPSYFSSLFKQKTGVNFSDYVLELRIRHAKRMLAGTDDKIADISERVGFRNATYFNKMFKRYTGVSPNAFRRLNGKGAIG